ncbi:MAG: TerC family protein [Phycisphaerales bacterium]|nr:TerC family protein [Phycisphaerales bacterium]
MLCFHTILFASANAAANSSPLLGVSSLIALVTLTALEIVLGIDNVVFIAILSNKLPESRRAHAQRIGLLLAMITRVLLLLGIAWVMKLTTPLFELPFINDPHPPTGPIEHGPVALAISGRDLVLFLGGLFLIAKATWEIRHQVGPHAHHRRKATAKAAFGMVIAQIVVLDLVFSLDSVITAVGMAERVEIMIAAVVIAIIVMMASADAISGFIVRHPSMKILALSFLVLIGVLLVADGLHQHIDRGYVYFAMAFALIVDLIQMRVESGEPSDESA